MARIEGVDEGRAGWFVRFVYWMVKRAVGKVVTPIRIMALHARVLFGYGAMEQVLQMSTQVPAALKTLASLRTSTQVGCPF